VQSVERSFLLLEALAERPLGVSALATASGLSPGTIHRLLRTLVDLGYVRQELSRDYALGPGCLRLGARATAGLADWIRPHLERVVREVGESGNLATLEGDRVVYLAHVPSSQSVRMFTEVGSRAAVHATGVGKAILAQLPEAEVRALVGRTTMVAMTPHTVGAVDDLVAQLTAIQAQGFALDDEEQELGVRCVAVAVPAAVARLAVSVSGPSSRVTDEVVGRAVPLLQDVAAAIAAELGQPA
jgi:IclR family acetate operon transcriptional repressor